MAETLAFAIAQTYCINGTGAAHIDWNDVSGTGSAMLADSGEHHYFRTFLANNSSGDGSRYYPYELLNWLDNNTSGEWSFRLNANGFCVITYLGGSTGSMNLYSPLCQLLGFSGTTKAITSLATNGTVTSDFPVTHVVFSVNFRDDSGWTRFRPQALVQQTPTGRVYGLQSNAASLKRRFGLQLHPKDIAIAATPIVYATPAFTVETDSTTGLSRMLYPMGDEPGQTAPWSVIDALNTSAGVELAIAWGNLQETIAEQTTADNARVQTYDVCSFTQESLQSGGGIIPSDTNWDARRDITDLEVMLTAPSVIRKGF